MHLIQDVIKAFKAWEGHTTAHAVEQTYKMGYDKGVADTEAKYQAGLGGSSPVPAPAAPASTGDTHAGETESGETLHEEGEHTEEAAGAR